MVALNNVSIKLENGEILGIVGMSGSGKSTLLKLIAGLERMDSGQMLFMGHSLEYSRNLELRQKIQMIFQDAKSSFDPKMKIKDSLNETLRNFRLAGNESRIDELIIQVGLNLELKDRLPSQLSGGQCQRMAIVRAISVGPKILLCDEITAALDVSAQASVLKILKALCRQYDMSMIFVSHDLSVVAAICDNIIVMKDGNILEYADKNEIMNNSRNEYTKLLIDSILEV